MGIRRKERKRSEDERENIVETYEDKTEEMKIRDVK